MSKEQKHKWLLRVQKDDIGRFPLPKLPSGVKPCKIHSRDLDGKPVEEDRYYIEIFDWELRVFLSQYTKLRLDSFPIYYDEYHDYCGIITIYRQ